MKSDETKRRIIKAAKECFDRYGEKRVSLEDISAHAGVHAQTVYRLLKNRQTLHKEVMVYCLTELGKAVTTTIQDCHTLEDAIIKGTMTTLEFSRNDKTLNELLHSDFSLAIQQVPENKEIENLYKQVWRPVFVRAQKAGEFSSSWTYRDFSRWLRGIQYILVLRQEMSRADHMKMLRHFMYSGFVVNADPAAMTLGR